MMSMEQDTLLTLIGETITASDEVAVSITGSCNILGIYNDKLISIEDWGYTGTTGYSFEESVNLSNIASPRVNTFK